MNIVYEDEAVIVCRKEAGMPVQSASLTAMDLVSRLKGYLAQQGNRPYLGVVHRLDQPVQGLLVFAKDERYAAALSAQLADGRMKKEYRALACPSREAVLRMEGKRGEHLENYLLWDAKNHVASIARGYEAPAGPDQAGEKNAKGSKSTKKGNRDAIPKLALLDYEITSRNAGKDGSLWALKIHLLTGRAHQIRVQMAGAGLSLAGDKKYGTPQAACLYTFPALCACGLSFLHPADGRRMTFAIRDEDIDFMSRSG